MYALFVIDEYGNRELNVVSTSIEELEAYFDWALHWYYDAYEIVECKHLTPNLSFVEGVFDPENGEVVKHVEK